MGYNCGVRVAEGFVGGGGARGAAVGAGGPGEGAGREGGPGD